MASRPAHLHLNYAGEHTSAAPLSRRATKGLHPGLWAERSLTSRPGQVAKRERDASVEPNPSGSPAISRVEPAGGGHALGWAASQLAEGGQTGAVAGDNQPSVARGGTGRAKPGPEPAVSELSAAQAGGFRQGERDGARPEASEESSAGAVVLAPDRRSSSSTRGMRPLAASSRARRGDTDSSRCSGASTAHSASFSPERGRERGRGGWVSWV